MKEFWMKRRIASLFFAVLLLLPLTFSLAATTPVVITSDDVKGNVGDTVSVTLNISIEPPKLGQTMDSLQFLLVYDSSALEFVSIQEVNQDRITILGAQYLCSVTANTGKVGFTAAATDGSTGSGVLMHVRFKVLSPVSTMLTLKNVAYSFVNKNGTQDRKQGGTINLGRVTGQSAPSTIAPASAAPMETADATLDPSATPDPAASNPPYIVTEKTSGPNVKATPEPETESSDVLAYIVFGLFIVVALLVCVVLTLMIVRRGRSKNQPYFDDEDEDEPVLRTNRRRDMPSYEDEDEPAPRTVRRRNIPYADEDEPAPQTIQRRDARYREAPPEEDDGRDQVPIDIVRRGKK